MHHNRAVDIKTLLLTAAANTLLAATIMMVVVRTRRTYSGFGWWTAGMLCIAGGTLLFLPAAAQTNAWILVFRNTLLMAGLYLIFRGLVLFRGEYLSRKIDLLVIGSFALLFGYYCFVPNSLDERIVIFSGYQGLICAAIVTVIWRNRPAYFGSPDRLLSGWLAAYGLFCAYRVIAHAFFETTSGLFVEQSGGHSAYILVQILTTQLIVLTLISMNSERIEFEYTEARQEITGYIATLEKGVKSTLEVVTNIMKLRDPYTAGHEERVSVISRELALELGWTRERAEELALIATIHDVGKIGVPAEILSRPGKLSEVEYGLVRTHAELGYEITKDIQFGMPVGNIIYCHHERMDGSGYPRGLKGDEIPMESRVLMVADALESMTSHRPYKAAVTIEQAKKELQEKRGTEFDPVVVDAALNMIERLGNKLPVDA